ncbi:hypothetical protein JOS77_09130 [Chromobacterium haemolyticum]|nr:hypothetical protein JOS77_09130 [Chromobacterium haemolyticum]
MMKRLAGWSSTTRMGSQASLSAAGALTASGSASATASAGAWRTGSHSVTVVPRSGWLSNAMRPDINSTSCRQISKPSPVPP